MFIKFPFTAWQLWIERDPVNHFFSKLDITRHERGVELRWRRWLLQVDRA